MAGKSPRFLAGDLGETPLLEIKALNPNPSLVTIYAKCEFMNPTASIKDRMVRYVLEAAEKSGELLPGGHVIAASSGNTAAAISSICAQRGYRATLYTTTRCSQEKVRAITMYGASVLISDVKLPVDHPEYYENAAQRAAAESDSYHLDQYNTPMNGDAYYHSLAPEIDEQLKSLGKTADVVVAGASTGGTISGVARYMKDKYGSQVRSVMPDPTGSKLHQLWSKARGFEPKFTSAGEARTLIEGVGKGQLPGALDVNVVDEVPRIQDVDAVAACQRAARQEGLMIGGSSGLNLACALQLAKEATKPTTIVFICPDHGLKYASTYYNPEWLAANGFTEVPAEP